MDLWLNPLPKPITRLKLKKWVIFRGEREVLDIHEIASSVTWMQKIFKSLSKSRISSQTSASRSLVQECCSFTFSYDFHRFSKFFFSFLASPEKRINFFQVMMQKWCNFFEVEEAQMMETWTPLWLVPPDSASLATNIFSSSFSSWPSSLAWIWNIFYFLWNSINFDYFSKLWVQKVASSFWLSF